MWVNSWFRSLRSELLLELMVVALVLASSSPADAQTGSRRLGRFRTILRSGERVDGSRALLGDSSLVATLSDGGTASFPRSDLLALDVATGSYASEGLAIGATIGGLLVLVAALQTTSPDRPTRDTSWAPATVGSMGVLGLIGAVVGRSQKKWQKVSLAATFGSASRDRLEGRFYALRMCF